MAKNTRMIKVTMTGYFPAANILDRNSIEKQHKRMKTCQTFADDQLQDAEVKFKDVNRLMSEPPKETKRILGSERQDEPKSDPAKSKDEDERLDEEE